MRAEDHQHRLGDGTEHVVHRLLQHAFYAGLHHIAVVFQFVCLQYLHQVQHHAFTLCFVLVETAVHYFAQAMLFRRYVLYDTHRRMIKPFLKLGKRLKNWRGPPAPVYSHSWGI